MKSKIIISGLIAALSVGQNAVAQSSSTGTPAENKTIILDGKKFPMSAAEYNSVQQAEKAKKATSAPAVTNQPLPVVAAISNEEIQKINQAAKAQPAAGNNAAPASKTVSGQYADKTIPGTLVPAPNVVVTKDVSSATPAENAVQPKLPEILNNQPAQKAEAVIPESVAPAPAKVPQITKQGSGK